MSWITDFTSQNKPLVALAPMDGYCDSAFRAVCRSVAPDIVVFSEFYSADGLHHNPELVKRVLTHDPIEHPLVFQIFGNTPEIFLSAGKIIESYGAQWVDINMGCPAKKVVKCGYGSGLMVDRDRAMKIVNILAENLNIPVSVKTRLGWNGAEELVEFGKCLEQAGASLISVHGRTYKQEYTGDANWEPIRELQKNVGIPVLGNGDCKNYEDGMARIQRAKSKEQNEGTVSVIPDKWGKAVHNPESRWVTSHSEHYNNEGLYNDLDSRLRENDWSLAGFMIARWSLWNPWCFLPGNYEPTWNERIEVMARHMAYMVNSKWENRACLEIRKHFTHYLHGFEGARVIRKKLAMTCSVAETAQLLEELRCMY